MLNFKLEERIKPNEDLLVLLQKMDYKVINGAIKTLEGTNVKIKMVWKNKLVNQMYLLKMILNDKY